MASTELSSRYNDITSRQSKLKIWYCIFILSILLGKLSSPFLRIPLIHLRAGPRFVHACCAEMSYRGPQQTSIRRLYTAWA